MSNSKRNFPVLPEKPLELVHKGRIIGFYQFPGERGPRRILASVFFSYKLNGHFKSSFWCRFPSISLIRIWRALMLTFSSINSHAPFLPIG